MEKRALTTVVLTDQVPEQIVICNTVPLKLFHGFFNLLNIKQSYRKNWNADDPALAGCLSRHAQVTKINQTSARGSKKISVADLERFDTDSSSIFPLKFWKRYRLSLFHCRLKP